MIKSSQNTPTILEIKFKECCFEDLKSLLYFYSYSKTMRGPILIFWWDKNTQTKD